MICSKINQSRQIHGSDGLSSSTTSTRSAPSTFRSGLLRLLDALTIMPSRASLAFMLGSVRAPSATRLAARFPATTTRPTLPSTMATLDVAVTHTLPSNAVPAGPGMFVNLWYVCCTSGATSPRWYGFRRSERVFEKKNKEQPSGAGSPVFRSCACLYHIAGTHKCMLQCAAPPARLRAGPCRRCMA